MHQSIQMQLHLYRLMHADMQTCVHNKRTAPDIQYACAHDHAQGVILMVMTHNALEPAASSCYICHHLIQLCQQTHVSVGTHVRLMPIIATLLRLLLEHAAQLAKLSS